MFHQIKFLSDLYSKNCSEEKKHVHIKVLNYFLKKYKFPSSFNKRIGFIKKQINEHGFNFYNFYLEDDKNFYSKIDHINFCKNVYLKNNSSNFFNKKNIIYTNVISLAKELKDYPNVILANPINRILKSKNVNNMPDVLTFNYDYKSKVLEEELFNLLLMLYSKELFLMDENNFLNYGISNIKKDFESITNKSLSNFF